MDLADIPAAAAFLGAELPPPNAAESASAGRASSRRLHDLSEHSGARPMEPGDTPAAAAAALLGAAAQQHFYHPAAAAGSVADANMAQHYYAQNLNLASFATGFMPMYPPFGMFGGAPNPFLAPPPTTTPPLNIYDLDATALQNQFAAQFMQASPEQKPVYYEGIQQQLQAAASGLNDNQKQALLHIDPSLRFSMPPLEQLDANANLDDSSSMITPSRGGGVKRARTASNAAVSAAKKKPRKNKASSCEPGNDAFDGGGEPGLLNEESPDASSSAVTTPRATPRGRPPGSGTRATAAAAAAAAGVELTRSGKKKSMTPQAEEMRARKAKMTWPKGTFLIRLQDVSVRDGRNHIWLVDNHQLLQRYNNESGAMRADGSRVYHKTDRYTGWLCHEGFHYFPLFDVKHILRQDADTVTVMFPDEEDLQQAIEYQEQERARRASLKDADEPQSRPLPPSIRSQPAQFALQQQQHHQLQLQQGGHAHSTPSATSMTSSEMASTMGIRRDGYYDHQGANMWHSNGDDHHQMKKEEDEEGRRYGGGGMQMMRRRTHYHQRGEDLFAVSPSCSMTAAGDHQPSTSRRRQTMHQMPSLRRQSYWTEEDAPVLMIDDDAMDDHRHRREFKQEEYDDDLLGDLTRMK